MRYFLRVTTFCCLFFTRVSCAILPPWNFTQELLEPPIATGGDHFGSAVALSQDGLHLLVGANKKAFGTLTSRGDAFEFSRTGKNQPWSLVGNISGYYGSYSMSSYAGYGSTITLSPNDGNLAFIGAPNSGGGVVVVYSRDTSGGGTSSKPFTSVWGFSNGATLGDRFGYSIACNADCSLVAIGASQRSSSAGGVAFCIPKPQGTSGSGSWSTIAGFPPQCSSTYLVAPDAASNSYFGFSLAMSEDGLTLVVGSPYKGNGMVYVFSRNKTTDSGSSSTAADGLNIASWGPGTLLPPTCGTSLQSNANYGKSVSISADGTSIAIGSPIGGYVKGNVITYQSFISPSNGSLVWNCMYENKAPDATESDAFGSTVQLTRDGLGLMVTATGLASAYVFTRDSKTAGGGGPSSQWINYKKVPVPRLVNNMDFGFSSSMILDTASTIIVGAPGTNSQSNLNGSVFLYEGNPLPGAPSPSPSATSSVVPPTISSSATMSATSSGSATSSVSASPSAMSTFSPSSSASMTATATASVNSTLDPSTSNTPTPSPSASSMSLTPSPSASASNSSGSSGDNGNNNAGNNNNNDSVPMAVGASVGAIVVGSILASIVVFNTGVRTSLLRVLRGGGGGVGGSGKSGAVRPLSRNGAPTSTLTASGLFGPSGAVPPQNVRRKSNGGGYSFSNAALGMSSTTTGSATSPPAINSQHHPNFTRQGSAAAVFLVGNNQPSSLMSPFPSSSSSATSTTPPHQRYQFSATGTGGGGGGGGISLMSTVPNSARSHFGTSSSVLVQNGARTHLVQSSSSNTVSIPTSSPPT